MYQHAAPLSGCTVLCENICRWWPADISRAIQAINREEFRYLIKCLNIRSSKDLQTYKWVFKCTNPFKIWYPNITQMSSKFQEQSGKFKLKSHGYRHCHFKDKMAKRSSYCYNWNAYTGKAPSLCSIGHIYIYRTQRLGFDIEMATFQCGNFYYRDKTDVRLAHCKTVISCSDKARSLYWIRPCDILHKLLNFLNISSAELLAKSLTYWGLMTPFSDIDLGQRWLR